MASEEEFLSEWGITHRFGKHADTYFTLVTFYGDRNPRTFYDHVNKAAKKLSQYRKDGRLQLHIAGVTFGSADAVLVWQAKDAEAAKAFMDAILTGPGYVSNSMLCSMSRGFGPVGPGPTG